LEGNSAAKVGKIIGKGKYVSGVHVIGDLI
jgi:hypothetical protein